MEARSGMLALVVVVALADARPPVVAAEATLIDFDDVAGAPAFFIEATALRGRYAALGVRFDGPGDGGAAILDEEAGFDVNNYSAPNFLAYKSSSELSDGSSPGLPEQLLFDPPVESVELRAAAAPSSLPQRLSLEAFDASGGSIGTSHLDLTSDMQPLTISVSGIARVEISSDNVAGVIDDLAFVPMAGCPHSPCDVGDSLEPACSPCIAMICEQDAGCCETGWDLDCALAVSSVCSQECAPLCGDANDDGRVTAGDALAALKTAVGGGSCPFERCDFTGDGKILAADALGILRTAVGSPATPACPA